MPRVSREQMARNHARVLEEASRLVRERGADAVSIPEVMAAAGLTPGGFYKHFASKDDLLAQAGAVAFDARRAAMVDGAGVTPDADADSAPDPAPGPDAAFARFLDTYLSEGHRDTPGRGCPAVALAADAAHRPADDPLRRTYVDGVRAMAETLRGLRSEEGRDGVGPGEDGPGSEALAELATMVGAVVLARGTAGDDISGDILAAAHRHLVSSRARAARGTGSAP